MNVLGQAAGSQQPQPGQQAGSTQVAGAATGTEQGDTSPGMSQSQQPAQPNKTPGSGMFRDLRKYVQSNVPQAQKIGQAVVQQTGEQAQKIGQSVQQQQQKVQQQIQENQARIGEQKQFGQQQIDKALQAPAPAQQPQTSQISEQQQQDASNIRRFQDITRGNEDFSNVQGLNTSGQQAEAARIQQLGKMAERTPARRQLLQDTFSKQGSYQGGQKTLDDLIIQAGGAIGGIKQGVTAQGQNALQNIRNAEQQTAGDIAELGNLQSNTRKELNEQVTGAQTNLQKSLEDRAKQENESYQAIIKGLQSGQLTQEQANLLGLSSTKLLAGNRVVDDPNTPANEAELAKAESYNQLAGMSGDTNISHMTSGLASDQYEKLIGGIDYSQLLGGIEAQAGNVASSEEVARAQALGKLAGVDPQYLPNIDVGGFEKARTGKVGDLKNLLAQQAKALQGTTRQAGQKQIYANFFGDPGQVNNWDDQYSKFIEYYTDPQTGRERIKLNNEGIKRFGGKDISNQMDQEYQRTQQAVDKVYGTRGLQIAPQAVQDGGIMDSNRSQARRQALQGMAQRERNIK